MNCIFSLVRGSPIPLCKTQSHKNIWPFHTSRVISKIISRPRLWDISHESKKPVPWLNSQFFYSWLMMTEYLTLFVQGTLEVWFMTFIDSYKVHVLSKPRSKLNTTVWEQFILKTIKKPRIHHAKQNGSRITFNSTLHLRVTLK